MALRRPALQRHPAVACRCCATAIEQQLVSGDRHRTARDYLKVGELDLKRDGAAARASVMRSDYRRYWNRATAGYRDAGRRPPLAYKAIRAKIRSESVREPLNRTARNA